MNFFVMWSPYSDRVTSGANLPKNFTIPYKNVHGMLQTGIPRDAFEKDAWPVWWLLPWRRRKIHQCCGLGKVASNNKKYRMNSLTEKKWYFYTSVPLLCICRVSGFLLVLCILSIFLFDRILVKTTTPQCWVAGQTSFLDVEVESKRGACFTPGNPSAPSSSRALEFLALPLAVRSWHRVLVAG